MIPGSAAAAGTCPVNDQVLLMSVLSRLARLLKPGVFLVPGILFMVEPVLSEEWIPVYEEPRHRLVFENDHAMILNVYIPAGDVSLYHEHRLDLLYVTISGTTVWAQPLGGEKREADVKTGDLRFSSDNHGLPHVHRVGNIGLAPFHVVGVGIKDEMSGLERPIEGDTSGMLLDQVKPHASVYRIRLEPGVKSGMHTHNLPVAAVNLTHGTLLGENGEEKSVEAGEYHWYEAGLSHQYENTGNEPIEIIEIQWR